MNRREIIKYTTMATGAMLSSPLLSALLTSCEADLKENSSDYTLQFFSPEQFSLVRKLVDVILPATDSPSATELGVDQMMDTMIGKVYTEDQQKAFTKKFSSLVAHLAQTANGKAFERLSETKQKELLLALENSQESSLATARAAYLDLKQQTIAYYLNTKEIGTKFLNYLPVPGEYEACISLDAVGGKVWAI